MVYQIIDNETEEKEFQEQINNKITPEMLGLKPTTDFAEYAQQTIIDENPDKVKDWIGKGPINIMEAGSRFAYEFDGTYYDVVNELPTQHNKNINRKIAENKRKAEERNKRVNNGTASILDRVGASLDRWGDSSYQAQINAPHNIINKPNDNLSHKISGVDKAGNILYGKVDKNIIYNRDDLTKKINFIEAISDPDNLGKSLPFVGSWLEGKMIKDENDIKERIRNGEPITQSQLDYINRLCDKHSEEYIRGYTIGGQIGANFLPSVLAFASEMALGGAVLKGIGLAGKGIAGGAALGKNLLKTGKVSKNIAKGIAFTSGHLAEAGLNAAVTTAVNPGRLFATYQERRLNDEMKITDRGTVIFSEAKETPAKALFKSLGQVYISYFTEGIGAFIGGVLKAGGNFAKSIGAQQFAKVMQRNPVLEKLIQRTVPIFAKAYEKLNNLPLKGKSADWLKSQVKFDGFIEELGEEVLEDILNLTIGTDNEERTLENYVSKIMKTPEEWAVLTGTIALQGTMLSLAGNTLGNHMHSNGVEFDDIVNVLNNSTEAEKIQYIDELIKRGDIKINENAINDNQAVVAELKNKYFTQNLNAGLEKEEALAAADIQSNAISSLAKNIGMDVNELNKEFAINTQTLTVEQAKAQQQADTKVLQGGAEMNVLNNSEPHFQAAMYKSPKRNFEEFYEQVQQDKNPRQKSYYTQHTNGGVEIDIFHDVVRHDEKKHSLTKEDWTNLFNALDNGIEDKILANKSYYRGTPVLFKVNVNGDYFGVSMEIFPDRNIITTAFKSTEKGVDAWIEKDKKKSAKTTAPNLQSGSSIVKNNNVILGQTLTNIITDVREKFKPFNNKQNIYYQSAYHGTPHRFDEFSLDNIGTGEGNQVHGWGLYFAENKDISEGYRKSLTGDNFNNEQYYYNEELIEERSKKAILSTIVKNGIDKVIQVREKNLEKYKYDETEYQTKKEELEWIKTLDESKIEKKTDKGQLYKVDIPETDVLLDEDLTFNEQPENVKNILKDVLQDEAFSEYFEDFESPEEFVETEITDWEYGFTGGNIYNRISRLLGGEKEASLKLNEYGIKGITYNGYEDGRCYVIFDDKAIKVLETYYQSQNGQGDIDDARGFTYQRFNFDGTTKDNLIVLLKNKSDKSTLLHEFAHVYLTTLNNLALRNVRAKELLNTVNKWLNYNGVEYTTKQHEKFANGFVAYVKSGKAPTYGLKRAFENFKRWLNDLYTNLTLSDDIVLDDSAKKVFDELLGDNTIDAKDKKVEDLINKAKQNALLRLSYEYAEKRKITPLHLTEKQRRFRDTAYDILYTAAIHTKDSDGNPLVKNKQELYMLFGNSSDYQKKNKGIKHRAEKIEQYLLEVDDPFSGNNGFHPEWAEFFHDPGVSYENMESGADAELLRQALDVINEKRYLYDADNFTKNNEFNEEDIKKAQYELEYFIDDYKNTENKDITLAAFFEWADTVHPYIQEDIITQWENRTNEIDRYENLTEFQKAKEDLKLYAAALEGYGDYSSQFAEYARKIIKRLDFMTEHDKMKIFDKLKEYNSFREIERNLDSVMDYAETLNDVSLRRNLADSIINEIKRTTPEVKNGTKKTRYDYQTNKLFERLREINRMKQEDVKDLYDAYVNGELERQFKEFETNGTITGKTEDYFEDIENSFLQFKANGMYYNSTEMLQTLLEKIQNAKLTGKVARDEIDFQRRMNQQNWINNCAQAVEAHKGTVGILEKLYSMEANFDSLLSMIFNDKIKDKFSLDLLYAKVDGKVGKDREEVLNKIADVFGYKGVLKGAMLNNKFIKMANDKYTIRQRYANKEENDNLGVWDWETITLSKMEILYYYIQAKNPTSYEMLTDMGDETRAPKGQFDRNEFEELLSNLSPQEKLMGNILQMAAEKYYPDLNKYHIKKHHIDMGKVTCYFPRKSELKEVNELDLFNQYTEKSTNPKFVKMRSAGPSIRIAPANPVNVLFNHIQKANTIIIMGEQLDLMNKVFRDNDLKTKIKAVFDDKVYTEFMQHVTANLYDGQVKTLSNAEGIISRLMSNVIATPMFIKPQIGIKQVLGLINYGLGNEHVGSIEWLKAFIKTMKHPGEAINFMMQDEYLKDRLTRANLNDAMKSQVDNKLFSRVSLLNDYFSLNMRYGDLLNLCLGGKAYVDVLMKKGFTKEQAFELFRQKTISDQQSSINSTLSNMQRNSKNNPFARLIFAYQNTPHQYFRICANAVIQAKRGKISKRQAVKTIFIYWYLLPLIFNMAGSLSPITFLTTGDPEELFYDMKISCLGGIACLPFFGEWVRAAWAGATGEEYFGDRDWFTRVYQITESTIRKFKNSELSFEDVLKALEIYSQGPGIPLEEIDTQIEAFGDYANGDIAEGALKTLGYSRFRAKKVTGKE